MPTLRYGRRLSVYWRQDWRIRLLRLGHARLVQVGPPPLVAYCGRMGWLDADRAVERSYQREGRAA